MSDPVIGTVVVSYKRPELLRQTLTSYIDTVTLPCRLIVVDNGGSPEAVKVALKHGAEVLTLRENRYPGYAVNVGWDRLVGECDYLHRSDNDVEFLPAWCDELLARFDANPNLGQLGLRTVEEEGQHPNVGGNCVVTPDVFDRVRWDEEGWRPGRETEDYWFSVAVRAAGFEWERVQRPCIVHHGTGTPQTDAYYVETWTAKGLL